jgi:CubicO group peptidase (beta-lactamase class C family)
MNTSKFQTIINKTIDNKSVFGTVLTVAKGNEQWTGSAGNLTNEQPYFIASTTKLYITALILKLKAEGKLLLDDNISKYLSPEIMHKLHVYKDVNYSDTLTISNLLAHTSGLSDYFEDKGADGKSLLQKLQEGADQSWTFEQAVEMSKKMPPKFAPDTKGKAHYSDTNFQLLGKIIEIIYGKNIGSLMQEVIFQPLGLKQTYMYADATDKTPAVMYFKNKPLDICKAMTSFGADGGIVSTSAETMVFLKAFFNGYFFPKTYLPELYTWNSVMFPLEYGVGIMKFQLPSIFTLFRKMPAFIGHSGLSGAFAYYIPEKEVFLSGTVNQINNPGTSYKMLIEIVNSINSTSK